MRSICELSVHCVSKSIPDIIDCNLKQDYQILVIFGTIICDTTGHQTTAQVATHPTSASPLPAENRTREICLEMNKNINKKFSPDLWPLTALTSVYQTSFRNVELKKRLIGRLEQNIINIAINEWRKHLCVPVFVQRADILNIYCKQLDNRTIG